MAPSVRDRLKEAYEESGLVLVLGAGVSCASGLPNWQCLLKKVAEDQGERPLADEIERGAFDLPVAASVLEQRIGNREEFVEAVRSALYRDLPPIIRSDEPKEHRRQELRKFLSENSTLSAVATMCAAPNKSDPEQFRPNPRVHAVVTFNFDALLPAFVRAAYDRHLLRTTERASAGRKEKRISLYQMHGHLRFDGKAGDLTEEAPDLLVLTEQDYFDFFNNPTSMFNYTFLYLLREWPCLFIGLSMKDGNLRRLLHLSVKERRTGYTSEGRTRKRADRKVERHFAILPRDKAHEEGDRAFEQSLLALGTRVLRVDSVAEIPTELQYAYEAKGDWNVVSKPVSVGAG